MLGELNQSEILFYQTENGQGRIEVRLQDGSVWLSQKLLAELFGIGVNTINYHIKGIYKEKELLPEATPRKYRIVQTEGERQILREVDFYNLDMILAVGFRVRSHRGTQFRQWATERLKEYIVKGFTLDDERLSQPAGRTTLMSSWIVFVRFGHLKSGFIRKSKISIPSALTTIHNIQ